jgi:hypothetical protein
MGIIANWLNDAKQAKEANLIVDATLTRLVERSKLLDKFFPIRTYSNRNFMGYVVEKVRTLASIIGADGQIPRTSQGQIKQITTSLVKIALGVDYTEKQQLDLLDAINIAQGTAAVRGLPVSVQDNVLADGNVIYGTNNTLASYLIQKPSDLAAAVLDTIDFMAWQCVFTGQIDYTDPFTNSKVTLDWRDPDAAYAHFPSALTANPSSSGTEASTVVWTNTTYANGIYTLENDVETYQETNGYKPAGILMSTTLRTKLMRQEAVINLARNYASDISAARMSPDILNRILENRELPPLIVYDEFYEKENNDGTTSKARFVPQNKYAFVSPDMGERALGVTLESRGSLTEEPKPGIFTHTYEKSKSPILDTSEAIASAIPIVLNPKRLFARQVFSA